MSSGHGVQLYETLAIGGRYDNMVAHFQPVEIPVAVGVRVFCNKMVQKILQAKKKQENIPKIDVYVASIGDMTQEKMELLAELWGNGVRAEAHLGNEFTLQDSNNISARFLVTFKKGVYTNSKKVKVKELESKVEKDEPRETVVEYLKARIKSME